MRGLWVVRSCGSSLLISVLARHSGDSAGKSVIGSHRVGVQSSACTFAYFEYIGNMELKVAVSSLSALAHGGRLAVFRLLVKAGPEGNAAGEIARSLDVLPNSLSANLTILSNAGLIASRRDGRSIIYTANYDAMSGLLGFLMEDCCNGAPEICAPLSDVLAKAACCEPVTSTRAKQ